MASVSHYTMNRHMRGECATTDVAGCICKALNITLDF